METYLWESWIIMVYNFEKPANVHQIRWDFHGFDTALAGVSSAAPRRRHAGTRTGIAGTAGRGSSGKVDRGGHRVSKKNHDLS